MRVAYKLFTSVFGSTRTKQGVATTVTGPFSTLTSPPSPSNANADEWAMPSKTTDTTGYGASMGR
jgi:hypothetical protein